MENLNYKTTSSTLYDEGLRQYFLKIYALMSTALTITAVSAFSVLSVPTLTNMMFNTAPGGYLIGMTSKPSDRICVIVHFILFFPLVIKCMLWINALHKCTKYLNTETRE